MTLPKSKIFNWAKIRSEFLDWLENFIPFAVFPVSWFRRAKTINLMRVDGKDYLYFVLPGPLDGLNGYVWIPFPAFKKVTVIHDPPAYVRESGEVVKIPPSTTHYGGILTYVPVHGGITFAEPLWFGMLYGFDTAHYDSEMFPRKSLEWIEQQIYVMIKGITLAEKLEPLYLTAETNVEKAEILQRLLDLANPAHRNNFGININLLSGEL